MSSQLGATLVFMLFPYPSNLAEWEPWAPFFQLAPPISSFQSTYLVGGWTNPFEKYESKWEFSPGVKIKHIWNLPTNTILFNQHHPEFTSTVITAPKIHPTKTLPVAPRFLQWQWCQIAWLDGECITLSGAKMQARWELKQGWTFGQIDVMLYEKTRIHWQDESYACWASQDVTPFPPRILQLSVTWCSFGRSGFSLRNC